MLQVVYAQLILLPFAAAPLPPQSALRGIDLVGEFKREAAVPLLEHVRDDDLGAPGAEPDIVLELGHLHDGRGQREGRALGPDALVGAAQEHMYVFWGVP